LRPVKKNYGVFLFRYQNGQNFRAGLKEDAQKPALKTWTEVYLPDKDWPTPPNRELSGTKAYRYISIARFVPLKRPSLENITHYNLFDYKSAIPSIRQKPHRIMQIDAYLCIKSDHFYGDRYIPLYGL
jgi:hypothetical protein